MALVLSMGMAGPVHGAHERGGGPGVAPQQLAVSAHRSLGCGSCHGAMEHGSPGSAAQSCQGCHRRAAAAHFGGPHGAVARQGAGDAPTCVSCHGRFVLGDIGPGSRAYFVARVPAAAGYRVSVVAFERIGGGP